MHRSGTSVTARALQLLGASLGDPDGLQPPGPDNPTGYWENRYLKELDDEILAALGGAWDAPPVLDPGWERDPRLEPFTGRAHEVLERQLHAADAPDAWVAWKDPRLALLLPFWRTITAIRTTVVPLRSPLEVAASLHARNGMRSADAAVLWLRYLYAAVRNDPGHLVVRHQDLFDDLPATLASISAHLGLPEPSGEQIDAVRRHVDPSLRHHRDDPGSAPAPEPRTATDPLMEMAMAVWQDGALALDALPPTVVDASVQGYLRGPGDAEQLMAARARAVEFEEEIRRRNRRDRERKAGVPDA
jgi:hypothetical protein